MEGMVVEFVGRIDAGEGGDDGLMLDSGRYCRFISVHAEPQRTFGGSESLASRTTRGSSIVLAHRFEIGEIQSIFDPCIPALTERGLDLEAGTVKVQVCCLIVEE